MNTDNPNKFDQWLNENLNGFSQSPNEGAWEGIFNALPKNHSSASEEDANTIHNQEENQFDGWLAAKIGGTASNPEENTWENISTNHSKNSASEPLAEGMNPNANNNQFDAWLKSKTEGTTINPDESAWWYIKNGLKLNSPNWFERFAKPIGIAAVFTFLGLLIGTKGDLSSLWKQKNTLGKETNFITPPKVNSEGQSFRDRRFNDLNNQNQEFFPKSFSEYQEKLNNQKSITDLNWAIYDFNHSGLLGSIEPLKLEKGKSLNYIKLEKQKGILFQAFKQPCVVAGVGVKKISNVRGKVLASNKRNSKDIGNTDKIVSFGSNHISISNRNEKLANEDKNPLPPRMEVANSPELTVPLENPFVFVPINRIFEDNLNFVQKFDKKKNPIQEVAEKVLSKSYIELSGSLGKTNTKENTTQAELVNEEYTNKISIPTGNNYNIGLQFGYQLTKNFQIKSGFFMNQHIETFNYNITISKVPFFDVDQKTILAYIDLANPRTEKISGIQKGQSIRIPLSVTYSIPIGRKFRFNLTPGIIYSKNTFTQGISINHQNLDIIQNGYKDILKPQNMLFQFGTGMEYQFSKNFALEIEPSYWKELSNNRNLNTPISSKSSSFNLNVGLKWYPFSKKVNKNLSKNVN